MKKLDSEKMEAVTGGVCQPLVFALTGICITICPPGFICPQ